MNEMPEHTWKLEELARQAGVSARTVRYYVQRGLLPAPVFRGRDTVYSSEHLLRLKVIRQLQERFLPLDAIQQELERCSPDDLYALITEPDAVRAPAATAQQPLQQPLMPPLPSQTAAVSDGAGTRWQRWSLAPGLELHLAETADAATRQQAEELLNAFRWRRTTGEHA
jgi:DNA-binding transcriptional MerR regulator